ncbi:glycosyltransferase family 4 protein [Gluconobacter morbifer]|uniref:Mannosyltransferase n=1 Tax=Gluconobacter morbifer G707 TaxID=1088869 RepID=G6XFC1_9PROT|nr:glycosyltransferase family 1 protein [Gluconobacter morbifer]EHH68879.1 mannosyltransferase [Gluconobacter morbifer G707]
MTTPSTVYLLDISRILARAEEAVPTGIDRVELTYARYLLAHRPDRVLFCALHPIGVMGGITTELAAELVSALAAKWDEQAQDISVSKLKQKIRRTLLLQRLPKRPGLVHLLVSHHHLTRPRAIQSLLKRTGARFVPMIQDLIPLEFPEYARPKEPARHAERMKTVARFADAVIVTSTAVRQSLERWLKEKEDRTLPVWHVPLGVADVSGTDITSATVPVPVRPYFVCLSTIEPRKNHLLLLNVWRRMVEQMGNRAPMLIVIGKRGWENENVVDMLERCPALKGNVIEYNVLSDQDVIKLLRYSQGLLFPSFTEGFGLPLVEALSLGVPAIASDISVLREISGNVAEYLDPLDGPAWQKVILEFAENGPRRQEQIRRLDGWKPVSWDDSIAQALAVIEGAF